MTDIEPDPDSKTEHSPCKTTLKLIAVHCYNQHFELDYRSLCNLWIRSNCFLPLDIGRSLYFSVRIFYWPGKGGHLTGPNRTLVRWHTYHKGHVGRQRYNLRWIWRHQPNTRRHQNPKCYYFGRQQRDRLGTRSNLVVSREFHRVDDCCSFQQSHLLHHKYLCKWHNWDHYREFACNNLPLQFWKLLFDFIQIFLTL